MGNSITYLCCKTLQVCCRTCSPAARDDGVALNGACHPCATQSSGAGQSCWLKGLVSWANHSCHLFAPLTTSVRQLLSQYPQPSPYLPMLHSPDLLSVDTAQQRIPTSVAGGHPHTPDASPSCSLLGKLAQQSCQGRQQRMACPRQCTSCCAASAGHLNETLMLSGPAENGTPM